MTEEKKRMLALNLSWMCKRDHKAGKEEYSYCPCLPQNGCPLDFGDAHCPGTVQDWLDWMNDDEKQG